MAGNFKERCSHCGYNAGHPWYYLLGGKVLTPKEIRAHVITGNYRGYRADDIRALANKCERKRSEGLRKIRQEVMRELKADIARYRQCVFQLHEYRRATDGLPVPNVCADVHTAVLLISTET